MEPFEEPIYVTRPLLPPLEKIESKLEEIWAAKWLTNGGRQHGLLEQELAKRLRVPYLSLFNNGTTALMVACQALRLSGDVITTPFTFAATPHVLTWNNIKPVFCDIDPLTMNIDANKIEKMITPKTTGILAVHVFGVPCDVKKIQQIADYYGLKVIYDAAHAFGVEINGRGIGTYGDISAMSFHATKLYHTVEGGAVLHNSAPLKQRIDFLKNFGIKDEETVVMPGINGKLNEVQAAVGLVNLEYVDAEMDKRRMLSGVYREELQGVGGITLPPVNLNTNINTNVNIKANYQYFVVRISPDKFGRSRDYVYGRLKEYNVHTRKYFYPLCSDYTCYRQLESARAENLPNAVQIGGECLALPLYGGLAEAAVRKICALIKGFKI